MGLIKVREIKGQEKPGKVEKRKKKRNEEKEEEEKKKKIERKKKRGKKRKKRDGGGMSEVSFKFESMVREKRV